MQLVKVFFLTALLVVANLPPAIAASETWTDSTDSTGAAKDWQVLVDTAIESYSAGNFELSEKLLKDALADAEKGDGGDDRLYKSLENLALVYVKEGLPERAEPLLERALAVREAASGKENPLISPALRNLALLYMSESSCAKAIKVLSRLLSIEEKSRGPDSKEVADVLNHLGEAYGLSSDFKRAEGLLKRALAIREKLFGQEHRDVANSLNNLGGLYVEREQYDRAQPLLERAVAIEEKQSGHGDASFALVAVLSNLAELHVGRGEFEKAELLLRRALLEGERRSGLSDVGVAKTLCSLASVLIESGRLEESEAMVKRALDILEKDKLPKEELVEGLIESAELYAVHGQLDRSLMIKERIMNMQASILGDDNPQLAAYIEDYADTLKRKGELEKSRELKDRARQLKRSR